MREATEVGFTADPRKGGKNALGHFCRSIDPMVSGIGERLHGGWVCSCPVGHRRYRVSRPARSGTTSSVAMQTLAEEGEAFGKEAMSGQGRFSKCCVILGKK